MRPPAHSEAEARNHRSPYRSTNSMEALRVLLAIPEFTGLRAQGENLGIAYIEAALLRERDVEVQLFNRTGDSTNSTILQKILVFRPHVVGLSLTSHRLLASLMDLTKLIKRNHPCLVLAGGHYLMFRGEFAMNQERGLDVVVLGEGDETIIDIVSAFRDGRSFTEIPGLIVRQGNSVVRTGSRTKPLDLDSLAFPTREPGLLVYNISASRGCYTTCSFCSVPQFTRASPGKPFRLRSSESVREEVALLRRLGATAVSFVDDVFLLPGVKGLARAILIADIMSAFEMNWSFSCRTPELTEDVLSYCQPRGLCNVGLGLESGSEEVLARFSKRAGLEHSRRAITLCRKYAVSIQPYFIMFEPDMSLEDVWLNVDFLDEFGLLWPSYARTGLDPHPGTPSFDYLRAQSRILEAGHRFVPLYLDERVKSLRDFVRPVLDRVRPVELSLPRLQFKEETFVAEPLKAEKDSRLILLSRHTAQFFRSALTHSYNVAEYIEQVGLLTADLPCGAEHLTYKS